MFGAESAVVRASAVDFGSVVGGDFARKAKFVSIEPTDIATDKVFANAMLGACCLKINTPAFADDFCANDFEAFGAKRLSDSKEIVIAILHWFFFEAALRR